jgi:uncharacterized protein YrrD
MRSGKDLIGKPIYSQSDGRHLGTVKDLYVDSGINTITGIFVGSEGLISRRARLIPSDKVAVLGVDAVLTVGSDVIRDGSEFGPSQNWIRRDSIQGRIMQTAGGTKVGSVGDLLFDDDSKVVAFALARVNVEGPIARNRVVMRTAVRDAGGFDGTMIVDLTEAEQPPIAVTPVVEPFEYDPLMRPAQSEDASDQNAGDDTAE